MKIQKLLTQPCSIAEKNSFQGLYFQSVKGIFLFFFILTLMINVSAQEVRELKSVLTQNDSETNSIRSLVNDLQPAIYFHRGELEGNKEETPLLIDTDVASVNKLYVANLDYSSIEIIRIKINNPEELNLIFDASHLNGFVNLRYILFFCTFDICEGQSLKSTCELEKILKIIGTSGNNGISFFYLISIPS